ncbi:MAG: hypothetical protein ACM3JQ_05115, partial [Candidatus Eiseniibacteriota bacterium]
MTILFANPDKGTRFVQIEDKRFIIIIGFFFTVIILGLGLETIAVQDTGVLAATSDLSNIPSSKNTQDNT